MFGTKKKFSLKPSLKTNLAISHPVRSSLRNEEQHTLLMEQREEENQQEIAKLKAEIKSLKLELFQMKSKVL